MLRLFRGNVVRAVATGMAMLAVSNNLSQTVWAQAPAAAPEQAPASAPAIAPAPAPDRTPAVAAAPSGGTIKGTVKMGAVPLPGVAVTAKNSLTGKLYATTTDVNGVYSIAIPKNGRYVVKAELAAFASTTKEVIVNAAKENGGLPDQTAEFSLELASRAAPVAAVAASGGATGTAGGTARAGLAAGGATPGAVQRTGRQTQVMVAAGTDEDVEGATGAGVNTAADVSAPSMNGIGGDDMAAGAGGDSIAVSGQQGQTNALAGFSQEDIQNRIQNAANDIRNQGGNPADINNGIAGMLTGAISNGGFGGPGGGPFGGPPGGGGGFGGPGGGGGGGGRGGGGGGGGGRGGAFRGQNPNQPHGSFAYTGSNNALNADSFSVTGIPIPKPSADRNTLIGSITGTPYIPGLTKPNPKQFVFVSVQETRNTTPTSQQLIVPTLAQRAGDFSSVGQPIYVPTAGLPAGCATYLNGLGVSSASIAAGTAVFPNSIVPAACFSKAATQLLTYYPLPNVTSTGTQYNYQTNIPGSSHSSQVSGRYNRSFGAAPVRGQRGGAGQRTPGQRTNQKPTLRQSIAENFAYSHTASASNSFSPLLGGKQESDGYSFTSAYTVGYGRLNSTATLGWNRSRSLGLNFFTNGAYGGVNPAAQAGLEVGTPVVYGNPFNYGVPSISISGGLQIQGLNDVSPSDTVNQTISFSDFVSWSHKRHNMRYGVDFHRIHADSLGASGVLGSFTFSGFATESLAQQNCNAATQTCNFTPAGSAMADFLLGIPQQTGITAGLNKIYLRGNSWDWYAQDDWRVKAGLTVNFGLRWEYFSPYSEKYNRLVNLNLTGSGSGLNIANVCGTVAPAGSTTGCNAVTPGTLVNPDKSMYSPRVSIAWSPKYKFTKNTVVRSGYGINYNTGQYSRFASKLAFQQPFAITQTNTQSSGGTSTGCTLANMSLNVVNQQSTGFNCSTQTTQSNFGVDPNYRLGMVQVYNLGIQRSLPQGVVVNVDYTGAYAGNLDMLRAPNRSATGLLNPTSGQFTYEDSLGYLRSNALAVNVRERLHRGVSLQATYTLAHSIDDASSVGGSGNFIAQNDQDLGAEESNSSIVRRNTLNGNFILELPFGPNRPFLNKGGVWSKIMDGYSVSGNYTFSSGGFATPTFSNTPAEIALGAPSSLRPNRVPGQPIAGKGSLKSWFNTGAFAGLCGATITPYCLPAGTYGNASRNSIELPGTVSVSGSLSRTVSLGDTRNFEARITANNVLNTVQYSGVSTSLNSPTYGQVTSAAAMRSFTYTARFRF